MNQETLLCKVAEQSGYTLEETRRFYQVFIHILSQTLSRGEEAQCLPDWGRFTPKLNENLGRNADSPRRPRKTSCHIQFKASKSFKNALLLSIPSALDKEAGSETANTQG